MRLRLACLWPILIGLPTLEAPAATHTGWNIRKAGFGEGELCDNNGTMIPFAATREERQKSGDPRLSMAERYPQAAMVALSTGNVYPLVPAPGAGSMETDPLTPLGEYANAAVARERIFDFHAQQNDGR